MSNSYRTNMAKWLDGVKAEFKDYVPMGAINSLYSALSDKSISNDTIDKMAEYVENATRDAYRGKSGAYNKGDEKIHLVPQTSGNMVYFHELKSGTIPVVMKRQENGLFSYCGSKDWITKLGGRGEFSQIFKMLEDGDYFHDNMKKKPSSEQSY